MPETSSIGMRGYGGLLRWLHRALVRRFVSEERVLGAADVLRSLERLPADERQSRIWFHAASVGELESVWPLIEKAVAEPGVHLVITVFSSSAHRHLIRNSKKLPPEKLLYAGYSPFEGSWGEAITSARVRLFVTAKYEAWPELWHSLGAAGIPLAIIGAKLRSSLKTARAVLKLFRGTLPPLELITFDARNVEKLRQAFPRARIEVDSDPRWDRVFRRLEGVPERVAEIENRFKDLPRPWLIFGQVWPTDLDELHRHRVTDLGGSFFFVPHKIDPASLKEIEIRFREMGLTPVRTSEGAELRPAGRLAILVDEMGFLAELYRIGDSAYVGGGFGSGVHSTIEPAVAGLAAAAGPNGSEKFDEIAWLSERELLIVLRDETDWKRWMDRLRAGPGSPGSSTAAEIARHRGAADRVWNALRERLRNPGGPA